MLSDASSSRAIFLAMGLYTDFRNSSRIFNNKVSTLFPIPNRDVRSILRWISIHVPYIALDFSKTDKVWGGGGLEDALF